MFTVPMLHSGTPMIYVTQVTASSLFRLVFQLHTNQCME